METTNHACKKRYIVAQRGARRGYAVPYILGQAGLLERFYTDACGNVGWGYCLRLISKLPGVGQRLRRLANRRVPDEIIERTKSFTWPDFRLFFFSLVDKKDPVLQFQNSIRHSLGLGNLSVKGGFSEAKGLYVMLNEFSPLIIAAKDCGLIVVSDIYILISTERILAEERIKFPEWEPKTPDFSALCKETDNENDVLFTHVDYYVCPSELVQDDLVKEWGVPLERTLLIPYGMDSKWLELTPNPQPGRVIFVGSANLRKGIHYLAMAAEELKRRGRCYDFRIVGDVSEQVLRQPMCQSFDFLGRIPRDRVYEEFVGADVFVLPTLAEGSAGVTYEALAAGVPQVVTRAAGSVVRDDIEGRIVSERDPIALADAIEQIIENREIRDRMAYAARERARDYTWEKYGERLVAVIRGLAQ